MTSIFSYCSSVMFGLKGKPTMDLPVLILVLTTYLHVSRVTATHRTCPDIYLLSGSRSPNMAASPKSEGG